MTETAIVAEGLRKTYKGVAALDGFGLSVPAGTVCGLLGPNGAGKTTAVRILATLLRFDAGRVEVAGADVSRQPELVRDRIALTGQYSAVDGSLSGRQNLVLFGRLQHLGRRAAKERAEELLEQFDLTGVADRSATEYSGGMQRRLDLAASLIRAPQVLFLDEPTTGLDPRSRNQVWDTVRKLVADGTTVLLTTQYLDEADHLADRISVVDTGRVVAEGTPDELKARIGADRLEVVIRDQGRLAETAALLSRVAGAPADADPDTRRLRVAVTDRVDALVESARALRDAGIAVDDLGIRRPTLDEAFLRLTGHRADEKELTGHRADDDTIVNGEIR
ncbi:ATP-binding cassette domain-containing protein [Paractinoplanes lichenicola]|uniref:ATP-binding cassette domain-containing protein n=1 Tax=Paractinoplanes lichenicola TaxID=2802976 RepID=A0ABS1VZK5_9ACTN|nr:ATP-binding cassette domain-containing protein [Actinoplanes lichenicola]MBL7259885.1 ATP-binding cassette domain-containing protein [Actinoplanes lichenicola]